MKAVNVTKFKAECLGMMDDVHNLKTQILITKRGKSWVKIIPVDEAPPKSFLGALNGLGETKGDLTLPVDETWEAEL